MNYISPCHIKKHEDIRSIKLPYNPQYDVNPLYVKMEGLYEEVKDVCI